MREKIIMFLCLFFCVCGCSIDERYGNEAKYGGSALEYYVVGNKFIDSGHANMRAGNFQKALEDFTKAIEELGDNAYAYGFKGLAKYKVGADMEGALADLNKAIELKSSVYEFYAWRAEVYRSLGENGAMEKDFHKAEKLKGKPGN